ncbi:hypothetical protein P170DRAFT_439785 [Aspergillus steynii IBT 23096]|uniref:STEEP1 domain-containing protein n=1 Tax=Aspergillus steynii IBT 23096 TaxID=1392250 RepID=A0A2I2FZP0_9EURO|nr:uncharacterized protein P170DRAFT_439785 [Aspergillus steynii IBT 23096]PLB46098.1 hypothetical protein P170DRAFT_439785 [Aspergillus steynii IBT 23096]
MSTSDTQTPPQQQQQQQQPLETEPQKPTLPMHTNHCRFCNHLLLATTHSTSSLPRRKEPARDGALILPLPSPSTSTSTTTATATSTSTDKDKETSTGSSDANETGQTQTHYSILLSTAVPDRRATMVRREDGFEKRWFVRCGRCRVVVGYFLDAVHFPAADKGQERLEEEEEEAERAKVVYLLPGALVETEDMGHPEKMKAIDREWSGWIP